MDSDPYKQWLPWAAVCPQVLHFSWNTLEYFVIYDIPAFHLCSIFAYVCAAVWTLMSSGHIVLLIERRAAISYELLLEYIYLMVKKKIMHKNAVISECGWAVAQM